MAVISTEDGLRVGDYGTVFAATVQNELGVAVDLTTASNIIMRFRTPSGTGLDKSVVVLDATGGQVYYVLEQDVITEDGKWYLQVITTFPASEWASNPEPFMVYERLPEPV